MENNIRLLKSVNEMNNSSENLYEAFNNLLEEFKVLQQIESKYRSLKDNAEKSAINYIDETKGPVNHKKLCSLLFHEITTKDLLVENIEEQRNNLLNLSAIALSMAGNKECNEVTYKLMLSSVLGKISKINLNNNKGAEATKAKYIHLTSVAISITKKFSEEYPKWLSNKICGYRVKSEIDRLIEDEMRKEINYKKANLIAPPTMITIQKHRRIAFKKLNLKLINDRELISY
jgi:hypothetical protein